MQITIISPGGEAGTQSCYNILCKMSSFHQKITRPEKKKTNQETTTHKLACKQTEESACENKKKSDLTKISK